MKRPVFTMPAVPTGWEGSPAQLVRIIDPLGDAIAWFAPELGGCCAGYAVRRVDDLARGDNAWRDIVVGSPSVPASGIVDSDGASSRWRFVERDPASCTMDRGVQGRQAGYWRMTASLADSRLSLDVRVENPGATPIRAGICLNVVLTAPPGMVIGPGQSVPDREPDKDGIILTVESSSGHSTVRNELAGDVALCTITDHQPSDRVPVVLPDAFRRLLVQVNL